LQADPAGRGEGAIEPLTQRGESLDLDLEGAPRGSDEGWVPRCGERVVVGRVVGCNCE